MFVSRRHRPPGPIRSRTDSRNRCAQITATGSMSPQDSPNRISTLSLKGKTCRTWGCFANRASRWLAMTASGFGRPTWRRLGSPAGRARCGGCTTTPAFLPDRRLLPTHDNERHGADESLLHFPICAGDHMLADHGYSTARGIRHVAASGGHIILCVNTGPPVLRTTGGAPFDLLATVTWPEHVGAAGFRPVVAVEKAVAVPGRVCDPKDAKGQPTRCRLCSA